MNYTRRKAFRVLTLIGALMVPMVLVVTNGFASEKQPMGFYPRFIGKLSDYPQEGAMGMPPRNYVTDRAREARRLLLQVEPVLNTLSCSKMPEWESIRRGNAGKKWVQSTARLHGRIFEAMKSMPRVLSLSVLLGPPQLPSSVLGSPRFEGNAIGYSVRWTRTRQTERIEFISGWDTFEAPVAIDSKSPLNCSVSITPINGSQGGDLAVLLKVKLRCFSTEKQSNYAGNSRIVYNFSPFKVGCSSENCTPPEVSIIFNGKASIEAGKRANNGE